MNRYKVEVWKRPGPELPPHVKEERVLIHTLEIESSSGWTAVVDAAYKLGLNGDEWMRARAKYILRCHELKPSDSSSSSS